MTRLRAVAAILACALVLLPAWRALAGEDIVRMVEQKRGELALKEEELRKEEERLKALRADVDGRIARYSALLEEIEKALGGLKAAEDEELMHLVKTYEAMQPAEAAARLSILDEATAVRILASMKSKQAGRVMGAMEPGKAASLTKTMAGLAQKFPSQ
ncbi:MAG: hypothetical protein Kow0025_04600 [Thermodesulfovibrionales bacterium]